MFIPLFFKSICISLYIQKINNEIRELIKGEGIKKILIIIFFTIYKTITFFYKNYNGTMNKN